jgi:hypothetical protein
MSEQLVLHHTYDRGLAFDVSEHGNHGELLGGAGPAFGEFFGTMEFTSGADRIRVQPSASFTDMRSVRVRVRFQVVSQIVTDKQMLVEGDGSFQLFHEGFSLTGSIIDANGNWNDTFVFSDIPLFQPDHWYEVEFHHDGISRARLWLNGNLVRERHDVPGPVRGVIGNGVVIGRGVEGWVDDVKIWTYDPEADVRRMVEQCCLDRGALDALLDDAGDQGWDAAQWTELVRGMLDLGTEIGVAARGGDPQQTEALGRLTRSAMLALAHKDARAFADVFRGIDGVLRAQLTEQEILGFGTRALDQLRSSPFGSRLFPGKRFDVVDARRLAGVLCLDDLLPNVGGLTRPDLEDRPPRPDGDPRTDVAVGTQPLGWNGDVIVQNGRKLRDEPTDAAAREQQS